MLQAAGHGRWLRAAQQAGTVTQQESLLLSACFSSRQRCTTLLLPRAAWGMPAWGQPDASTPRPATAAGCQGPCSNLCLPLLSLPLLGGDTASQGELVLLWFKEEQLAAARSIPGWAVRHSPPRWQPERALHQAAPAANNYVLSKSMGYNWTIKISLSSWLWVPQPAACWGRPQPAATETASRLRQPPWALGTGCTSRDSTGWQQQPVFSTADISVAQ